MALVRLAAGELVHRVDILRAEETTDDYGDPVQSEWVEATVQAKVEPITMTMAERLAAFGTRVAEDITHRVVMRHWPGLTAKHKLRHDGRTLEIASLANVKERGVILEALCREAR